MGLSLLIFVLCTCIVFYCVHSFISPELNSEHHIEALLLQLRDCIYDIFSTGFGERDRARQGKDYALFCVQKSTSL